MNRNRARKGKEYKSVMRSPNGTLMAVTTSGFSSVDRGGYFTVSLDWQSAEQFDGASSPLATNATYTYDTYGNPTGVHYLGDLAVSGDERFERYQYAQNTSAWIVSKVSNYTLYAADNATKVRQALSYYNSLDYGSVGSTGSLTKAESWLSTSLQQPTQEYEYDTYGNVIKVTDSLGRETKSYYGLRDETHTFPDRSVNALDHATDAQHDPGTGNILWTERNGIRTSYAYDIHGRIVKEVQPYDTAQSPTKSYTYSTDGTAPESVVVRQRTTANNTLDTYYLYDGFGQLVQVRSPADGGNQVVVNVFYDASGRVNATSNPYFEAFSENISTPSTTANITIFTYDALDRPIRVTNPDGTTLNTTFDRWNVTAWDPSGHRIQYELDAYGRISKVREFNNNPLISPNAEYETYVTTYRYDAADQLRNITDAEGNVFAFGYDSLGRRVSLDDPDMGAWTYTYDLAGNLVSQTGGGGNLVTGDSYYREYNDLNQLIRIRSGNLSNGTVLEEYTYDAFGDRVKVWKPLENTTIYTPFRELTRVVNSSGTFDYLYVYDGSTLVARKNPDGSKWFYHPDHLGSTTLITDESGNVVEETFYEPYGAIISGGTQENKLYTGHYADSPNQYYFGARYFNPLTGRFTQPDTLIPGVYNPQALNRYSYGLNNPYLYVDPTGNVPTQYEMNHHGGRDGGQAFSDFQTYLQNFEKEHSDLSNADLLRAIREDVRPNGGGTNPDVPLFIYTKNAGFVDVKHFIVHMLIAETEGTANSLLKDYLWELQQCGFTDSASCNSFEDRPSNALGREAASEYDPTAEPPGSFIIRFIGALGPTDTPEEYWTLLPATPAEYGRLQETGLPDHLKYDSSRGGRPGSPTTRGGSMIYSFGGQEVARWGKSGRGTGGWYCKAGCN